MAIAPASSAFNLLPPNDNDAHGHSFPSNFLTQNEEHQLVLLFDATMAEELQFQEALKASLFTSHSQVPTSEPVIAMPSLDQVKVIRGESSLNFCEICSERKENEKFLKNGNCDHSFCLDCMSNHVRAKIKEGIKIVTCPGINCYSVLSLDSMRLLCEYMLSLWKEAHPMEVFIPNFTCSKELHAKTSSENGNEILPSIARTIKSAEVDSMQIVPVKKAATASRIPIPAGYIYDDSNNSQSRLSISKENEMPKSIHSSFKNMPTLFFDSPLKQSTDSVLQEKAAAAAADDDDSDSHALPDSDDYDSEGSPRSPETCKKSKWFKKFVEGLANLSFEEIKDPARQWHCPACQGGAGAIKRYLGLHTLIQHAKTKGSKRLRLHRELAQLLEENLLSNYKENSAIPTAEAVCPKWKGLRNDNNDYEIVWPPMVIIANTFDKKDDNDKWIGMTNQELLDMFSSYDGIVKVQQPYNWKGHSGFSILIFESSAKGYLEAERLHMHFKMQGTGRDSWIKRPVYILPTGERQLHCYLAKKEDLEIFNKHCFKGKPKLKYEMRSYQEMVVNRIRQMTEDNHQLLWLKNRVAEQQRQAQELEESNTVLKEKMQMLTRDMDILRRKASQQHEQSMEEMESLEQFYKEQIRTILEAKNDKDEDFEKTEQEEEEEQENANLSNRNDYKYSFGGRNEETTKPIKNKEKGKEAVAEAESFEPIIQEEVNLPSIVFARAMKRRRHGVTKPGLPAVEIDMHDGYWDEF